MAENEVLAKLAGLFSGLRPYSRLALSQGLQAREVPGVGATLIVKINADPTKPAEVYYTTAPSELVAKLY